MLHMAPNGLNAQARSQAIGHAQPTKTSIKQGYQSIIAIRKVLIFIWNYMRFVEFTETIQSHDVGMLRFLWF